MDFLLVASLLGSIYFIVFCRLMIHAHQSPQRDYGGFALVTSLPARSGLDAQGLRYWRMYWAGWMVMLIILGVGMWWRYTSIFTGLSGG